MSQTLTLTPTTTLAVESGNNTSAADTFTTQTNNNLGAGNVSKVPTMSLLYAGSTSKIYAHFMPWFGGTNHMNVGYASNDPAQVHRQVTDMMSRGIDGAIVDWYGPSFSREDQTTQYMRTEAESRGGKFVFAVMEDAGSLKSCANTSGCNVTTQLISDLTYAYNAYEQSSAYMKVGGRPLVFTFGLEVYTIDWTAVAAGAPGNPLIIFRNSGGFTKPDTSGSFAWEPINTADANDIGLSYLDNFYATGLTYKTSEQTIGGGWKGFNDSLSAWHPTPFRLVNQNCGQTWVQTLAEAGKYYSTAGAQLPFMQLVTWNDYEEGTEIESGIDNCVSVAASLSGTSLSWSVTGSEAMVDHYTVFVSADGVNLMSLRDVAVGTHALDLSVIKLGPGAYSLFVKAVGKPSLSNHMTAAVPYSVANLPPTAVLAVSPTSGTASLLVNASTSGSSDPDGSIASSVINFGDGTVVSGTTASHTYANAGTFTVTATVTDNLGLSSSVTKSVTVAAPVATASVLLNSPLNGGSYNSNVHVSASAQSTSGIIAMAIYVDNVLATKVNASSVDTYIAMQTGSHYIVAQAWSADGSVSKTPATISVTNLAPVAALNVTTTSGMTVSASTAGSSDPDGTVVSSTINFGDGHIVDGWNVSHTYSHSGRYTVRATVTDNMGISTSTSKTVSMSNGGVSTSNGIVRGRRTLQ